MQVILTQNVPNLGSLGDTVKVKDGYGRNFLLPRGMAIVSGTKKSKEIEHQRKHLEKLRIVAIEKAKAESEKVSGLELTVTSRSGANGRLFGSVTNRDVQAALLEKGYELDRRSIQLHEQIKNVGTYSATVRLHTDVKVDVVIHVKPEYVAGTPEPAGEEIAAEGEGEATEETTASAAEPTAEATEAPVTEESSEPTPEA